MEALALYPFKASANDELSFTRGKILKILEFEVKNKKGWAKAELEGVEGFVPKNYIQEREQNWFFNLTTKAQISEKLKGTPDGTFLVCDDSSSPGDFVLVVKLQGEEKSFKVLRDSGGKYFLWLVKFNSLNEIVQYHKTSSVSRNEKIFLKLSAAEWAPIRSPKAMAKFDFKPQEDGELEFKKGDVIQVLDKTDQNWWRGELNGKEGLFPASYVQVMEDGDLIVWATARYDFQAKEAGDLAFKKGDLIQVLDKTSQNWWKGKLNGKEGLIPATYIEIKTN